MKIFTTLLLLTFGFIAVAQSPASIKGTLKDAGNKETLVGATIIIKGTQDGGLTDVNGNFEIAYKGSFPVTLVVSYLGYNQKEILIENAKSIEVLLEQSQASMQTVTVSARRRKEVVQEVPIPITVLGAPQIENSVSFSVNRVKELIPSVQLYSSNPRNTTLNIRGLGSTFGLTNDGIDPGVGFYVDGVYYARPAATTIDFIDIEQIEVMRGPQGTLFGKNTTAGNFNVTTRKPSFTAGGQFELSYGNYGFMQAKGSVTGPVVKNKIAARLSFTGTQRDGLIYNVQTEKYTNSLNNLGVRGQILFTPNEKLEVIITGDHSRQRPDGYAQVYAGTVKTKRADYRQFDNIIADLDYSLPSKDPFERKVDHDTPWRSNQDLGGLSLNAEYKIGKGKLTSTSAWRYWNWDPSSDRDFTGLDALRLSQAPSRHDQWSQEFRYAGELTNKVSLVAGLYSFGQSLRPDGAHVEELGKDQWRFSQSSTSALWSTPGLLDGYGIRSYPEMKSLSSAFFTQADWTVTSRIHLLAGFRINYDEKNVKFRRETYGGLQTTDSALLVIKNSIYSNQEFSADITNTNYSGQLSLSYALHKRWRTFATYSTGFKPVGLNLSGLPSKSGKPMTELATVKPERVYHFEAGFKSEPIDRMILNVTVYNTEIRDYQTLVQTPDLAVNRGYLSNADKVRVQGIEVESGLNVKRWISLNASVSYTDARYVSFTNAPPPLEETGGPSFKDISGGRLPGVSKWALCGGVELKRNGKLITKQGDFFAGIDYYYRSDFSSSPSPSAYLNIEGYSLVNARVGFRNEALTIFLWSRNLTDTKYFEQLLPGAGNAGHYAAVLGDPATCGITLKTTFQ